MENTPQAFMRRVLEFLKSRDYRVSASRLRHMEFITRRATVYQLNKAPEIQEITLYDYQNRPAGLMSIRSVPQIIDAPPIFRSGERVRIAPALALTEGADVWTALHEICHLLSVGPYLHLGGNRFCHCLGTLEFSYQLRNGRLEKRLENGHNGINELLTDYAAWHFTRLLCGDASPFYSATERFGQYADALFRDNVRLETLIGWYFSGNASAVSEFLLGGGYADYESLCRALYE